MENFEVCIRVIIQNKGKILVCFHKKKGYYFFPGGHLEFGEKIKEALFREVKEELGIKVKKFSLIGLVDNFYEEEGKRHHEINLVFKVMPEKIVSESREDHINFYFLDRKKFSREKVLPIALRKAILKWQKDKKFFWASQIKDKTILN
jgi:ADP-ribose pyrophosphatase YjhB (NUDIX family)